MTTYNVSKRPKIGPLLCDKTNEITRVKAAVIDLAIYLWNLPAGNYRAIVASESCSRT